MLKCSLNKYFTLFFIFAFFIDLKGFSQHFPIIIGDNLSCHGRDIDELYDHGLLITGFTYLGNSSLPNYGWLIKTDINGSILWGKKIGNGQYPIGLFNSEVDVNGSTIISGSIGKYDEFERVEPLFIKLNACGEVEWCQVIQSDNETFTWGRKMIPTIDSGYIGLMAYYTVDTTMFRISLIKLNENGEPIWIKPIYLTDTLASNEEGEDLDITADGRYIISGRKYNSDLSPLVMCIDSIGDQVWTIDWPLPAFSSGGISQTISKNNHSFYSAGGLKNKNKPMIPSLYKFDAYGNPIGHSQLLGDTIYGGGAYGLTLFNDTNIVFGVSWQYDPSPDSSRSEIIQTDTTGGYVNRRFLYNSNTPLHDVIETYDSKLAVLSTFYNPGNWDIYLWKLNSELQDDSLYTRQFTYDSLCPYPITSDTVDLDCALFVDIEEIPTKEEFEGKMEIWPVPAYNKISIKLPQSNPFQKPSVSTKRKLEIWNALGIKVHEQEVPFQQDQLEVNVSQYPPGVYFTILRQQNRLLARKKFVVGR